MGMLFQPAHIIFINKAGIVTKFERVVFRLRREYLDQLPALHFPDRNHMLANLRIDLAIVLRFHVFRLNSAVF